MVAIAAIPAMMRFRFDRHRRVVPELLGTLVDARAFVRRLVVRFRRPLGAPCAVDEVGQRFLGCVTGPGARSVECGLGASALTGTLHVCDALLDEPSHHGRIWKDVVCALPAWRYARGDGHAV